MRVLRQGMTGDDVHAWQNFLVGQGSYWIEVSGTFDDATRNATADFQKDQGLTPTDGVVGNGTYAAAMRLGFPAAEDTSGTAETDANWPPRPSFGPLSPATRESLFGKFAYVSAGSPQNPEAIRITDGWPGKNIVQVTLPQLVGINGAPGNGIIPFHTRAAAQLISLWQAWDDAGLMPLVLSFAGSWAPRFIRGSTTILSNHAWGSAFDINAPQNPLGAQPALVGQKGSTRKLVQLANDNGFYWGGHFSTRPDGMHFEIATIKDSP